MLQWVLPTAVGILIVAVGFAWVKRRQAADVWLLAPKAMLSARERSFHRLLVSQYPEHYIFAKLALSQLIEVLPDSAHRELVGNLVKEHVAAFVLCRTDYSVMAIIELDEGTRFAPGMQAREAHTAKALQSAGLRLVRIPPGPLPEGADLRLVIEGDGYLFMSPTVRKWYPLSA